MSLHAEPMPVQKSKEQAEIAATDDERRHIAGLLASVHRQACVSQRSLAAELGLALGLVNTYIKRCVRKGLIKVQQMPPTRYAYYLTPKGFAEKSRLTAEYLAISFTFFRQARTDCATTFERAGQRGWKRVGLAGTGDLAEIAILSANGQNIAVVALVDPKDDRPTVLGLPVFETSRSVIPPPDGWVVTAISDAQQVYDSLVAAEGAARVLAPALLSIHTDAALAGIASN